MCGSIVSNLRPLRLGEEKRKEEEERNHMAKIYYSALLHRATITRHVKHTSNL